MAREFPDIFVQQYGELVDDTEALLEALSREPQKSFRINTLKGDRETVLTRLRGYGIDVQPVAWYDDAFTVDTDDLAYTMERFQGTIYIQELASMLPPLIVREELARADVVLDACAAPGSKTTEAAAFMDIRKCIIANDRNFKRIRALRFNINKAGVRNALVTNYDLHRFPEKHDGFDVVLVDAPCSSDGTIRKSPGLLNNWTPKRALQYAARQKGLIVRAFDLLKQGGTLVYSTCSLSPYENEAVVHYLLQNRDATVQPIELDGFKFGEPVMTWDDTDFDAAVKMTRRVWPHHNDTDGFFVAKVTR